MNGKFSTLLAGILLASAFSANAADVVKVQKLIPGKSYVVAPEGWSKAADGVVVLTSDENGVAGTKGDVTKFGEMPKWTVETLATGVVGIQKDGKYLKGSATAFTLSATKDDAATGANEQEMVYTYHATKPTIVVGKTADKGQLKLDWVGGDAKVTVGAATDYTAFYAQKYEAADDARVAPAVTDGGKYLIKVGDKFLAPATKTGTDVELISIDFSDPDYKDIIRASWTYTATGTKFSSGYSTAGGGTSLTVTGNKLVLGNGASTVAFDGEEYGARMNVSLTDATGTKVFTGTDFVTYSEHLDQDAAVLYNIPDYVEATHAGAITSKEFVNGGWYNISFANDEANYLKDAAANEAATPAFSLAALAGQNSLWQVTVTEQAGQQVVTLKNKATNHFFTVDGSANLIATTKDQAYTLGMTLKSGSMYLGTTSASITTGVAVGGAAKIGLHKPGNALYTSTELNAMEPNGFTVTIATAKTDGTTDIEGADIFNGELTAVKVTGDNAYQLKDADGNYIVLDRTAGWGSSNDMNGNNANNRGFKFAKIDKAENIKADKHSAWFSFAYPLVNDKATNKELIITVYDDNAAANERGQLYVTKVADKYYLTVSKALGVKEVRPYVTLGGASLVDLTEAFVAAPTYYSIVKVTEEGKAEKALGVTPGSNKGAWLNIGTVELDQPEGQWYATSETDKTKLVLKNRENPTVTMTFASLYKTEKTTDLRAASTIYKSGTDLLVLTPTAVADAKTSDGYEIWDQNDLRDEAFTLGLSTLFGNNAYLAENHEGKHQLGLVTSVKEAATWKFTALTAKATATTPTDSVYVKNEITYWNANKKGGAGWDTKVDYLKLVPYTIANAENGEPLWYSAAADTASYICNPSGEADRFVVKKSADGKYNFIRVVKSADKKSWVLDQKMYAGFSVQYGNVQLIDIYSKRENDAFVIEKTAAPEYLKLNLGDTIRIFREGAESSLLFEKGEFLGLENIYEFTKMAPAMYVDTAFVNRTGKDNYVNNCYQYLLAVEPDRHQTSEECTIPGHPSHSTDITYGRYLVSLKDSADVEAKRNLHTNKYLNSENKAKFGFVKASHANDTLVIANSVYTGTLKQKNDSIYMGEKDFNVAKFAFKVADQDTKAFRIQTKDGYLKWMNGFIIATANEKDGDIFNLKATDENPTANEAIAAEGVQVIAGKGAVTVQGAAGKVITVANILGQTIANQVAASDNVTIAAPAGVVVVAVEGDATKVVVK